MSMPIRADDPRPPSEQIAAELREAIEAGDYKPGQPLPSTRQLMESHAIASMTVQRAIAMLRDEGLVTSHPGRGVFVRQPDEPTSGHTSASPKTLDEALKMLAEVNERLDRLETQVAPPQPDLAPEPAAERSPGIEP